MKGDSCWNVGPVGDSSVNVCGSSGSFLEARIGDVDFTCADISGIIFEPDSVSERCLSTITKAKGIDDLKYAFASEKLAGMRWYFKSNAYRGAEKKVTCALRRQDQKLYELILFDLTSEYGSNLSRPLLLICIFWAIFSVVYYSIFVRAGRWAAEAASGVLVHIVKYSANHKSHFDNYVFDTRYSSKIKNFRFALIFSSLSIINLGFRDYDLGRIIRLMFKSRTYYRAYGWARLVSGVQAVIGLYLVAIWVLSYFGHPFE